MHWQDIVISGCQICFVIALLPSLRSHHKPHVATSAMNFVLVSIITFCLATLKLWVSAVTASFVGITWLILAIQKSKLDNAVKSEQK